MRATGKSGRRVPSGAFANLLLGLVRAYRARTRKSMQAYWTERAKVVEEIVADLCVTFHGVSPHDADAHVDMVPFYRIANTVADFADSWEFKK